MRIGFDVSQTGRSRAGCGYFAESLVQHVTATDTANDYIVYPTFGDFFWDPNWRTDTWQGNGQPNVRRGIGHRTLEDLRRFWGSPPDDFEAQLGSPDIVHANNFYCPRGLVHARLIYTLYDLSFLENPEWTTEANRLGCFEGVFNASLHADIIVAISDYTKQHFLHHFPHYPADRIAVIHPASRFHPGAPSRHPRGLDKVRPEQFWLHVGTIEPRKNIKMLLDAFTEWISRGHDHYMVLAGSMGWLAGDIEERLSSPALQGRVIHTGFIEDEELTWLYENCLGLLFPSHFEGFGMPVLEAMSLGAVPIASDSSSVPEILGETGYLIRVNDRASLLEAMTELSSDSRSRARNKEACLRRSEGFSWSSAANQLLDLYRQLA